MVMFGLMAVVVIGFLALAVDMGYGWAQRRFMQNGADAGAFAAANHLASSVAEDSLGIYFYTDDTTVRRLAIDYAQQNRVPDSNGQPSDAVNGNVTLSYLDINNNVLAVSPTADNSVPRATARVRVATQSTFGTFFARVLGQNSMTAAARATAGIEAAPGPLILKGPWPFGVWAEDLPANRGDPFPLWDPQRYGDFKGAINFTMPCENWESYAECFPLGQTRTGPETQDPHYPGTNNGRQDVPVWVRDGFQGGVAVGNRILTYGGDYGHEIAQSMNDYINADPSTDAGGTYRYAFVVVWDEPEQWSSTADGYIPWTGNGSPDRVHVSRFLKLKLYLLEDPNRTAGIYIEEVAFLVDGPGSGDPPSPVANTVHLVE